MLRLLPGVAGACFVVAGVALLSVPAALIVAGAFLLLIDRRLA
jgi:hypothetical protein